LPLPSSFFVEAITEFGQKFHANSQKLYAEHNTQDKKARCKGPAFQFNSSDKTIKDPPR
jgi:hypothetical protein